MKRLLQNILIRAGYRVEATKNRPRQLLDTRNLRFLELEDAIFRRMFEVGESLNFIQVGAFDGASNDPIHQFVGKHHWRGVLVEPQPGPASELRRLYDGNTGIVVIEAALDAERGRRPLFTVDSNASDWRAELASFDRQHLEKHSALIPGLKGMIRETIVDCLTWEDVLRHAAAGDVDLLQIDAEGADAFLLSLFPFERLKPPIIHFEIKNLTVPQREDCLESLLRFGYCFAPSGDEDMLAVLG